MDETRQHVTVLLNAAVEALSVKTDGLYIDGTFGRGGHAAIILSKLGEQGRLLLIDKDPEAVQCARQQHGSDERVFVWHGSFADYATALDEAGWPLMIDGMLLDLGVSSPQLDVAERGFSFQQDGPLDMRMNPEEGKSASEWLTNAEESEIADVLWRFGDERFSKRIARAVLELRDKESLETTGQLAELIRQAIPRKFHGRKNPATKSFQAIRIFVNGELTDLERCLESASGHLGAGGRLVVISFHSLEDRIVKRFFKRMSEPPKLPRGLPIQNVAMETDFIRVGKAIKPDEVELETNRRARSSVMRVLERCA